MKFRLSILLLTLLVCLGANALAEAPAAVEMPIDALVRVESGAGADDCLWYTFVMPEAEGTLLSFYGKYLGAPVAADQRQFCKTFTFFGEDFTRIAYREALRGESFTLTWQPRPGERCYVCVENPAAYPCAENAGSVEMRVTALYDDVGDSVDRAEQVLIGGTYTRRLDRYMDRDVFVFHAGNTPGVRLTYTNVDIPFDTSVDTGLDAYLYEISGAAPAREVTLPNQPACGLRAGDAYLGDVALKPNGVYALFINAYSGDDATVGNYTFTLKPCLPAKEMTLPAEQILLRKGETYSLKPAFSPAEATDIVYYPQDFDPTKLRISADGLLQAVDCVDTYLYIGTSSGLQSSIFVSVYEQATQIALDPPTLNLSQNHSQQLTPRFTPASAFKKGVTWESSDERVATVDENGLVTGHKPGKATVTARAADGSAKGKCAVKVFIRRVKSVRIPAKQTMVAGFVLGLPREILPADASDQRLKWKSSKPSVASVDETGCVQALARGTTVISAQSVDGKKRASCALTVKANVFSRPKPIKAKKGTIVASTKKMSYKGGDLCVEMYVHNNTKYTIEGFLLEHPYAFVYEWRSDWICGFAPIARIDKVIRKGTVGVISFKIPRQTVGLLDLYSREYEAGISGTALLRKENGSLVRAKALRIAE